MTPEEALKFSAFLRPEVRAFAIAMEKKLRQNDDKGGWYGCNPRWLLGRVREEVDELDGAVNHGGCVLSEATDVANFAMMTACNDQIMELRIHHEMKEIDLS